MREGRRSLTGRQLRAARALAGVSGEELAERTNLSLSTIRRAEREDGPVKLTRANTQLLISALEAAGVQFLEADKNGGVGVRLAPKSQRTRQASAR
jgi:transcriptional regulator with XRE-family HTH domain